MRWSHEVRMGYLLLKFQCFHVLHPQPQLGSKSKNPERPIWQVQVEKGKKEKQK